jgi:hypothetical protein
LQVLLGSILQSLLLIEEAIHFDDFSNSFIEELMLLLSFMKDFCHEILASPSSASPFPMVSRSPTSSSKKATMPVAPLPPASSPKLSSNKAIYPPLPTNRQEEEAILLKQNALYCLSMITRQLCNIILKKNNDTSTSSYKISDIFIHR